MESSRCRRRFGSRSQENANSNAAPHTRLLRTLSLRPARRHRAWIEVGSNILADIWVVETTKDAEAYRAKLASIRQKFERVEVELRDGPYFSGGVLRIVDAVFAPVFRYFDVFEELAPLELLKSLPRVSARRAALHERPSVRNAVVEDYADRLRAFVRKHDGVPANWDATG